MFKNFSLLLFLVFTIQSYAQRYRDFEVGPMINFEYTSLFLAENVFNGGETTAIKNSGFEPNYAAGIYAIYYVLPKTGFGMEVYYLRTSSQKLEDNDHYNSLTVMPYVNFDPFRQIEGIYFGFGIGAAFIQESPVYGASVREEDVRVITVPAKVSVSYRIRNQFTLEVGAQAEVTEVVKDQVRRNALYVGLKVPVNRVFGYYR